MQTLLVYLNTIVLHLAWHLSVGSELVSIDAARQRIAVLVLYRQDDDSDASEYDPADSHDDASPAVPNSMISVLVNVSVSKLSSSNSRAEPSAIRTNFMDGRSLPFFAQHDCAKRDNRGGVLAENCNNNKKNIQIYG